MAADTPRRILDAAADEFAERGLAGARVDRIAERAGANKQRIYAYFGSKDQLFDRVVEDRIEQLLDAVPFDAVGPARLRGPAAGSSTSRTRRWCGCSCGTRWSGPAVLARLPQSSSHARKVAALRAVRGDDDWPADRLLGQVLGLVHGVTLAPGPDPEQTRADLHRAVSLLVG